MEEHIQFMDRALELAVKGQGYTSPNPMVGAVVVKNGAIIGEGWHGHYGGPHAEVNAIEKAGSFAKDATIYVTLEPCNHTGKTPPCTKKIIESGIKHVVMAMDDPNPNVIGGGKDFLIKKGIKVTSDICKEKALKLNEGFVKYIQTKKPFVTLKCASTLDGRIATSTGDSKWVTCSMSRQFVHKRRHAVDAIMVGIGTVKADNPSLTTRLESSHGSDPIRVILDTHLSISEKAKILHLDSEADTIIITGDMISSEKKNRIEKNGAKIVPAPLKNGIIDLEETMKILGSLKITSLLIEGGSRVAASALSSGIVDKVCFFYAPKIVGGDDGIPIFQGKGVKLMKDAIKLKDIQIKRFEDDIMIEGYI